jgi:hypothetical protein
MSHTTNSRFELRRLTGIEWIILDTALPENHPHRTVACVYEVDDLEYDVVWLRDLNLRAQYASPEEVLQEVIRTSDVPSRSRSARPVEIPHLSPLAQITTG